MEEIKVGEYARTENGRIAKLTEPLVYEFGNGEYTDFLENIVKHSENIIDLIEVGDYVNGYKVTEGTLIYYDRKCLVFGIDYVLYEKDIKSIVTKEQFASVEYRLEE